MSDLDLLTPPERAMFEWGGAQGIATERSAIVAWLRGRTHPYDQQIADSIERGAHLGGDDE